jgi:DNA-binding transcriptional regulator YdaS (Cro superfamily)
VSFETAVEQWQEGERRLAESPPDQQPALERVTQSVQAELRRRLGGAFTAQELAAFYEEGTDWATDVAIEVAPDEPFAWDARIVTDAAFARYLRAATDFAGGRRRFR